MIVNIYGSYQNVVDIAASKREDLSFQTSAATSMDEMLKGLHTLVLTVSQQAYLEDVRMMHTFFFMLERLTIPEDSHHPKHQRILAFRDILFTGGHSLLQGPFSFLTPASLDLKNPLLKRYEHFGQCLWDLKTSLEKPDHRNQPARLEEKTRRLQEWGQKWGKAWPGRFEDEPALMTFRATPPIQSTVPLFALDRSEPKKVLN